MTDTPHGCRDCSAAFGKADDARAHADRTGHAVGFGHEGTPVEELSPERRRAAERNSESRTRRERLTDGRTPRADY